MESFADALAMVTALRPEEPVYCLRPRVLRESAAEFQRQFPGTVMYAVKCNDHPAVLAGLHAGGLRHFDVASLSEIEAAAALPETVSHYMHPVKNRQAVELAYRRHGIRTFCLDHEEELDKIQAVTGGARDLTLVLRVDMPRFDLGLRPQRQVRRRGRGRAGAAAPNRRHWQPRRPDLPCRLAMPRSGRL